MVGFWSENQLTAAGEQICRRMLDLKENCVHPTTNKPYIKSMGGTDTSSEQLQVSMT